MKAESSSSASRRKGNRYFCNRCGYLWVEEGAGAVYCPNCYQKDVDKVGPLYQNLKIMKRGYIALRKKSAVLLDGMRDKAYWFLEENKHLIDICIFIIALIAIVRASMYFFLDFGLS